MSSIRFSLRNCEKIYSEPSIIITMHHGWSVSLNLKRFSKADLCLKMKMLVPKLLEICIGYLKSTKIQRSHYETSYTDQNGHDEGCWSVWLFLYQTIALKRVTIKIPTKYWCHKRVWTFIHVILNTSQCWVGLSQSVLSV